MTGGQLREERVNGRDKGKLQGVTSVKRDSDGIGEAGRSTSEPLPWSPCFCSILSLTHTQTHTVETERQQWGE